MNRLKLLLLEDEVMDAELIKRVLERSGMEFDAVVASDREGYLQAILNDSFDVILADNSLPQFNANNALQLTKENNISTPFILVTGTVSEDFAVNMMKEGAADYILKDRLQRLPSAILSAVNKYSLEAQRQKHFDDLIKNEALMNESEQLAHLGSWDADLINNTSRWSDENYRILDYEPGEVKPSIKNFLKRVHPDDLSLVKQIFESARENQGVVKFNCRVINKDRSVKYLENSVFFTTDEQGKVIRLNGFSRDTTQTILAGEMLQTSEANLRTIFDNTEIGYILLDTSFNILSFNEPVNKYFIEENGKSLVEGNNIIDCFTSDKQNRIKDSLIDALDGTPCSYEVPYLQPNGLNKWYYAAYHPVWNNKKAVIGVIMSQTDITGRKNLELQEKKITADLIQRNTDLEQFAYIVSHNLRGPVATILGISDLINDEDLPENDKTYFTNGLIDSVKKLDGVILDLNNIIYTKGAVNEKKELVHFSSILTDVTASIHNIIDGNLLTIDNDFTEVNEMITLKSYIYSIFYNLISNSIKYRRPNIPLKIEIRSSRIMHKIELLFRDNGIGIDLQRKRDQVFRLYKRFHPEYAEGKGMGLFMVKTQVESLGGRISVESEVNNGTQFKIEFELPNSHN